VLLTVESLLLATLGLAVGLAEPGRRARSLVIQASTLGQIAAGFLSLIAVGAIFAWGRIFLEDWPCSFSGSAIAMTIGLAILGQPVFAWVIALGMRAKDRR
jgi:hypothetical protein